MPIQDRPASAPSPQIVGFARAPRPKPIDRISVFGERRSGTNVLERLVAQNTALTAVRDHGWKLGVPAYPVFPQQCLFLVIVRHLMDWMASLYRTPFEAHRCLTRLPFAQFLPAEWEGLYLPARAKWDRIGHDVDLAIAKREILQLDRHPLDGRRVRYVAEMRAVKLRGHLSFLARDVNAAVLRYEDLARDQAGVLASLLPLFDMPVPKAPSLIDRRVGPGQRHDGETAFTKADRAHIRAEPDLEAEARCGYAF